MNKLVIPSIALAAILSIGAISFAPIDEASAVHTTLLANIEDQNRVLSFTADNGATLDSDILLITLATADDFQSEGFVNSAGTGACALQDENNEALITGTANRTVVGTVTVGSGNLIAGENIEIDIPADTTCNVYLHIISWE